MIDLISRTELNTGVLDVKQDTIYVDSDVTFFTDVPGMVAPIYGPAEVRERIDASEAFGGNGWMLWNPNNEPSVDALDPEA